METIIFIKETKSYFFGINIIQNVHSIFFVIFTLISL